MKECTPIIVAPVGEKKSIWFPNVMHCTRTNCRTAFRILVNPCSMRSFFTLVFISTSIFGFGQIGRNQGMNLKNRFALGVETGAYFDQSMRVNDYLVRPNLTMHFTPSLMITAKHYLGLHIGQQTCDLRFKAVEEAYIQGAEHEDLKKMTYGYDNIYQLGISYRFVQVFENGFALLPSFNAGALWAAKEGHYLDFYPDASNLNISKRFGTYPADDHMNIGAYISGTFDAGYQWKNTGFTLFGGIRFLMGEVEQKNQYVEEWLNSGAYISTAYFEKRSLRMLSFEVGIILNSNMN
ncbi:MAG: hypothetical protein ACI8ZM_001727 [Crocinitomix sp.]|jgi:hypothetical protein